MGYTVGVIENWSRGALPTITSTAGCALGSHLLKPFSLILFPVERIFLEVFKHLASISWKQEHDFGLRIGCWHELLQDDIAHVPFGLESLEL